MKYRLIATEPEQAFCPTRIILLNNAAVGERNDFIWTESDLPVVAASESDLVVSYPLLLATRHHGYSLQQLDELPLDVYICRVKDPSLVFESKLDPAQVAVVCWALMLAPEDERESIQEIYESVSNIRGNVNYINPVHQ